MERLIKPINILLIIVCFCSCNNKKMQANILLDFSYDSGWTYSYSLKIYNDGKAYLKKNDLKTNSLYVKDKIDVDSLYSILLKIKRENFANKYEDTHVQDVSSFNVIVYDKDKVSKYYVYGDKYPASLREIRNYVNTLSNKSGWCELKDTTITFSSMNNFMYNPKIIDKGIRIFPPKNLN